MKLSNSGRKRPQALTARKTSIEEILGIALAIAFLGLPGLGAVWGIPQNSRAMPQTEKAAASTPRHSAAAQSQQPPETAKKAPEASPNAKPASAPWSGNGVQRLVQGGITVEFSAAPASSDQKKPADLLEGRDAIVRFKVTEATGTALRGSHPSAWMDLRRSEQPATDKQCHDKIQSFLQSSLSARPTIDLNTYYILALNDEPNISVIDPLLGLGSSKLYTLVFLKSPGEDWVLSRDKKRLFVTMPAVNQVAVVDTLTWKVMTNLDVGSKPSRLAFQPDQHYLWVSQDGDAEGGVTVIDPDGLRVVARIRTGAGIHQMAFSDNDRYAFVSNQKEGTLSIIDVQELTEVKKLHTGPLPAALAFSAKSKAVYVLDEKEGTVAIVDVQKHEIVARMKAEPGLKAIRFTEDGRWGFVVNRRTNTVQVIDSSADRFVQRLEVGKEPDQISFTQNYAYIRSLGSEEVKMIGLSELDKGGALSVADFPGGQIPPGRASNLAAADTIVPAPEGASALVANPADKIIYYYTEGMAAPMGSFQNYRRAPRAVLVVDRSLRETSPGVYEASLTLERSGYYDVALVLDSPRVVHCFDLAVKPNPALKKTEEIAIRVQPMLKEGMMKVGQEFLIQFKVIDAATGQPRAGLKDVGVLIMMAPNYHRLQWAKSIGEGIYEVTVVPPQAGAYYVFWECPSLRVRLNQLPFITLAATAETPTLPAATSPNPSAGSKP